MDPSTLAFKHRYRVRKSKNLTLAVLGRSRLRTATFTDSVFMQSGSQVVMI